MQLIAKKQLSNWRRLLKSLTSFKELKSFSGGLDSLEKIAKEIIDILSDSAIVVLNGDLAAGKTTLVKSIVEVLGVDRELISSPTFSLQQSYSNRIFHYDFYRVNFTELLELGLVDEFEKEGLHFVEWASKELIELLSSAGFKIYSIDINIVSSSLREYNLEVLNA